MIISVASGKGGTGKTAIATSLAAVLAPKCELLDCDVEGPNAALFFDLKYMIEQAATRPVPKIDPNRCTHCGDCAEACQFNAIAITKNVEMVFEELCHPCGACYIACKVDGAISETSRSIGIIREGQTAEGFRIVDGHLNIGEAIATPLVKQVKARIRSGTVTIIDCPPGTGCPVVKAINGSDFAILVTEPTPFGHHDLYLAIKLSKLLQVPMGIVVNRDGITEEYTEIENLCKQENVPILLRIPFDQQIAEGYSQGKLLIEIQSSLRNDFERIADQVKSMVNKRKEVEG